MRHSRALSQGVAACSAAVLVAAALAGPAGGASQQSSSKTAPESYLVLTSKAAGADSVAAKLRAQGAKVTSVNQDVGMVVATSSDAGFREQAADVAGVEGVAAERVIGRAPVRDLSVEQENLHAAKAGTKVTNRAPATKPGAAAKAAKAAKADPLDANLWGMRMIKADQAHTRTLGSAKVKVGIMDTGVQADHPDLHANFDYKASRNFTTDIPFDSRIVDGPCESPNSCVDPVGTDDGGHGTHVAGTVAAALDGFGLSGVAPKASIVEVRAGQDSGYFFAGPTVNALTYSGDAGLDVVNMSFYVDPWLYNCQGGAPEDTPEQAQDQDVIIETVQRALDYAHQKGVTLVAAAGNQHQDLADPKTDATSPDFPAGATHPRTIDKDKCLSLPTEGRHVLGVTALGPSEKKADYSNWTTKPGAGEVELSAPGGWFRDGFGTPSYRTNQNEILSTYPLKSLQEEGSVDAERQHHAAGRGPRHRQAVPGRRRLPAPARAATTPGCRAPRWPARTPPVWLRSR